MEADLFLSHDQIEIRAFLNHKIHEADILDHGIQIKGILRSYADNPRKPIIYEITMEKSAYSEKFDVIPLDVKRPHLSDYNIQIGQRHIDELIQFAKNPECDPTDFSYSVGTRFDCRMGLANKLDIFPKDYYIMAREGKRGFRNTYMPFKI